MNSNIVMFSQTREIFPSQRNVTIMKRCEREKRFKASTLSAIKFIMLRKEGQTLTNSINFTTNRHCRYDNTQLKDGTTNHRIFTRKHKDPKYTNYGWMLHGQSQIVTHLPDISQILKEADEKRNLTRSIINTKVQINVPQLVPYNY